MAPLIPHWAHLLIADTHWHFREVLLKKLLTLELLLGQKYHLFASMRQKQLRGWAFSHRWDGLKHHTLIALPKVFSCWVWASTFRAFPEEGAEIYSEHQTLTLELLSAAQGGWGEHKQIGKYRGTFICQFSVELGIFWDRSCISSSNLINLEGFFITVYFWPTSKKYFMLLNFRLDTSKSYSSSHNFLRYI